MGRIARGYTDAERKLIAEGLFGDPAAQARALAVLDAHLAQPHKTVSQVVPEALFRLGQQARTLHVLRHEQLTDTGEPFALLWSPGGKALRAQPGFSEFARDFGFVDVWDKFGPPDMCKRNAPGDYTCD